MDSFEYIILGLLKDFKKNDLEFAIANNINLAKLIKTHEPHLITFARLAYPFIKNDTINLETVLEWLKYARPDFYEVLEANKDGRVWLEKQIKEIKEMIVKGAIL